MKTVIELKSIFIALVYFCIFCNFSLAQQIVTINMEDGGRITNHQLVDKDNSSFGDVTVVFSKITKEDDEYSFNMEFQLRGMGSGNRLFITDRDLVWNQLRSALQEIRPDLAINNSFLEDISRGRISVDPFFNNVSPGNAISLKNKFEKSGGYAFNRESRKNNFSVNKDLILQNENKVNFNLQFYLIEGTQLNRVLRPIPIQITFEGLDTSAEPSLAEDAEDTKEEQDEGTKEKTESTEIVLIQQESPCDELHTRLNSQLRGVRTQINRFENRINTLDDNISQIQNEVKDDASLTPERREQLMANVGRHRNQFSTLRDNMVSAAQGLERTSRDALGDNCKDDRRIQSLRRSVDTELGRVSGFQSQLNRLSFISRMDELEEQLDTLFVLTRDSLRKEFGIQINNLASTFSSVVNRFESFKDEYDRIKISLWYFRSDSAQFKNRFLDLQHEFDTIVDLFEDNESKAEKKYKERLRGAEPSYDEKTETIRQQILSNKNSLEQSISRIREDFANYPPRDFPWILAGVAGLIVLLLLFGLIVFIRGIAKRKRIKKKLKQQTVVVQSTSGDKKIGGLKIAQVQKDYIPGKGLSHVYNKIDIEYHEIDLHSLWTETTVSRVFISRELIKTVYRFFYNSLAEDGKVKEHGGYILGAWDFNKDDDTRYDVSLEHFIETRDDAINENYELNFGAKIGLRVPEEIRRIREKSGLNFSLTGWIHSHPEISIFLSQSDLNVQQTLSGRDYKHKLIALVLDPNTQDNGKIAFNTGIFSYRNEHGMNNTGNGGIPLIKWRDLYEWARAPVPPDMSNNYKIDMKEIFNNSKVSNIYLKDKCIINLSHFLDDIQEKDFTSGIFTGQVLNNSYENNHLIVLNDFEAETDKSSSDEFPLVGYFFYGKNKNSMLRNMISDIEKVNEAELVVICDNDDKNLIILTRQENGEFNSTDIAKKTISFYEIETWPTRKR